VTRVPGNSFGNIAVAQLGQCYPFAGVALAHVLGEHMHCSAEAGDEGLEAAAGADGAQLTVIADHDDLGVRACSMVQQLQHAPVIRHRGLVQYDQGAVVEGHLAVLQAPGKGGQRPARLDAGGSTQGACRLAGRRRADHAIALGLEGLAHRGQRRGLARAGHADDQLHAAARGRRGQHRLPLAVGDGHA